MNCRISTEGLSYMLWKKRNKQHTQIKKVNNPPQIPQFLGTRIKGQTAAGTTKRQNGHRHDPAHGLYPALNLLQPCWPVPSPPSTQLSLQAVPASLPRPHRAPALGSTLCSWTLWCPQGCSVIPPLSTAHTQQLPGIPAGSSLLALGSEGMLLSPRTAMELLALCHQPRCHCAFSMKHGIAAAPL